MARRRRGLGTFGFVLACALLATSLRAPAQTAADSLPSPSTIACLVTPPAADRPAYPDDEPEMRPPYVVRLQMTFIKADVAPEIRVLFSTAETRLREKVIAYTSRYRLPCLAAGAAPIVAQQEFSFVPDGRPVVWYPLRAADGRETTFRCLTDSAAESDRANLYPGTLLNRGEQGTVLAHLTFTGPDVAPTVRILFDGGHRQFAESARKIWANYRLPCYPPGIEHLEVRQVIRFGSNVSARYAFKDVKLRQFLGAVESIQSSKIRFDFNTMGCPFDVRIGLYQPYDTNSVGELGAPDPNRREFLEWLKTVSLHLGSDQMKQLVGSDLNLTVPCTAVDLTG